MTSPRSSFAPRRPGDRAFVILYAGLIWTVIIAGFGPQIARHIRTAAPPYPAIVHVHAAAFVGWLILFSVQILLVRIRRPDLHRMLGFAMAGLALAMVPLGVATAIVVDHRQMGQPNADPAFLGQQLADMVGFAGLVGAAILCRRDPSAHRRLILMTTINLANAGWSRIAGTTIESAFGFGFWGYMGDMNLGNDLLILGIGAYDIRTRRRLHPAYVAGVAWIFLTEAVATCLYLSPAWKSVATRLLSY